jgi:UDP-N-acetylmuramoylalanine-D-glutamate ligase
MRLIRRGGVKQLENKMRAEFKKNQRLDIGVEINAKILRPEAEKARQSGIETGPAASSRSGWQFDGKNCLGWTLFTPCTVTGSLLEAIEVAGKNAVPGDVFLLSPACSNFNRFRIYQNSDVFLSRAVSAIETATGSRVMSDDPNRQANETD